MHQKNYFPVIRLASPSGTGMILPPFHSDPIPPTYFAMTSDAALGSSSVRSASAYTRSTRYAVRPHREA